MDTIKNVFYASALYSLVLFVIISSSNFNIETNFAIVQPLIFFILVSSNRLMISATILNYTDKNIKKENVIIYGAGNNGILVSTLLKNYNTLFFFDDDKSKWNKKINGITILPVDQIIKISSNNLIAKIFIVIPNINLQKRREIVSKIQKTNLPIHFIDNIDHLINGELNYEKSELQIEDIILKNTDFDTKEIENLIYQKKVLITGCGGSIGSELVRQIIRMNPKKLILIDNTEFNLYNIQLEIQKINKDKKLKIEIVYCLNNICDKSKIEEIFKNHSPNYVYHAAAYKHVPLLEFNIPSAVENNVLGTYNLVSLSEKYEVNHFTLISSDKAVRPTNIMGATKRFSELITQAYSTKSKDTKFSVVRFGNVLGSTGSVFPLFRRQINDGGPVTVTHPDVSRFFMTINEAVGLILQSTIFTKGGEVFVLNMGEPIKIIDLAKKMIKLSGKTIKSKKDLNGDIEIKYIGLREGEKIFEEIFIGNKIQNTDHKDILKANEDFLEFEHIKNEIAKIDNMVKQNNASEIVEILENCVTGFSYQNIDK